VLDKIAVAVLLCLFGTQSFSQRVVEGVVQTASGEPIAYANVYLSSSKQTGTVTNTEGLFRIAAGSKDTLNFSHIGFVSGAFAMSVLPAERKSVIVLEEHATELGEVIIMPRDSLRAMLAKAFSHIKDNYPSTGTLVTGFYRETNQLVPENSFLYFAESIIQYYKPSYENKQYGPVKLVEGGKSELAKRHSISKVDFYGGLYICQSTDFVKQRIEFIHPDHYDEYDFLISATTVADNSAGYKITFTPRAGGYYKGEFYLEKESYAYAGARYQLSDYGLRRHNLQSLSPFDFTSKKYTVQYKRVDNKWNLHLAFAEGTGAMGADIRVTSEYVSTRFEPSAQNPIGESEAVPSSGVYLYQTKTFSEDFWQKRGAILRTNALDSTVGLLLKSEELKLENSGPAAKTASRAPRSIYKHIAFLSTALLFGMAPLAVTTGTVGVQYGSAFSIQKNVLPKSNVHTLVYELRYTTPKRLSYTFSVVTNLNKEFSGSYYSFGTEWSKTILGWKRPLSLQPGIAFFYADLYQDLGTTESSSAFQFGNSSIPAGPIKVYSGEQRTGVSPSLGLAFRFRSRLTGYVKGSLPITVANRELIAVTKNPAPFMGKGRMSSNADELTVTIDGIPTSSSGTTYRNFALMPWIGIRYGF
jgi:hypothetical protein